jgi:hypothetical protein
MPQPSRSMAHTRHTHFLALDAGVGEGSVGSVSDKAQAALLPCVCRTIIKLRGGLVKVP